MKKWLFLLSVCMILHCSFAKANISNGLVAHLTFENESELAFDSSSIARHGQVNGSGVVQIPGLAGRAVQFDGQSTIEVPATSATNPTNAITVAYWFKSDQTVGSSPISVVRHEHHFTPGQLRDSKNIALIAFTPAGLLKISTTWNGKLNDNKWHHLTATFGDGYFRQYIDGNKTAEKELSLRESSLINSGVNWTLGGKEGRSGEFYQGALDDLRIYNRVLTVHEINALTQQHLSPSNPIPADNTEGHETALSLSWHPSADPSDPTKPNHDLEKYIVKYSIDNPDFDKNVSRVYIIPADNNMDNVIDSVASIKLDNLKPDQTIYWTVREVAKDNTFITESPLPVWSFKTRQTRLVIQNQAGDQTVSLDGNASFTVNFTSVSKPIATWYTAGGREVTGDNISSKTTSLDKPDHYTATLTINNVQTPQEGSYYCLLQNDQRTEKSAPAQLKITRGLIDFVEPTVGTINSRWFYFSSASRPFGMVNLSPDTDTDGSWDSGYLYGKLAVRCFSHVHAWQLAGIPVMPTTGPFKGHLGMDSYQSAFSHDDELIQPGYHRLHLDSYDITAELTSTNRVGFHRYTFSASDQSCVLFDVGAFLAHSDTRTAYIHKINDTQIEGYSVLKPTDRRPKEARVYFSAEFSQPFESFGTWQDGKLTTTSADAIEGYRTGGYAQFKTSAGQQILLKVAISYTSMAQARKNLTTELPHWNFDQIVSDSQTQWNQWLSRIEIQGGTQQQRIKFYTDLWHSLLGRRIVSDVDGKYCDNTGSEPRVRTVPLDSDGKPKYPHYNFDALWGAHWTLNVLWSMAYPELMDGFANTMISMYHDGGYIPRGPSGGNYTHVMIGGPASSFFACAYNKGIRNYDAETAYQGVRKNAFPGGLRDWASYEFTDTPTGGGMPDYVKRGWVPDNIRGGRHTDGASMTLEYAYQDWCIAQFARALGKTDDYDLFIKRGQNYRNIWDPAAKLMHPRKPDGTFSDNFSPLSTHDFCESSAVVYTNFVPHDMKGLIDLFGGNDAYRDFLDNCFVNAQPARFLGHTQMVDYSNQPATQMAHLFNFCAAPWLTQKWVRRVKEDSFGDITPYGGYNGDEDQGQMGALGVLMAIGLFEMDGGCALEPTYEITSPIFDRVTIHLDNRYYPGQTFEIIAENASDQNMYIQSAQLNGNPLDQCWFPHKTFANGGTLKLILGPNPNKSWATDPDKVPPSASK